MDISRELSKIIYKDALRKEEHLKSLYYGSEIFCDLVWSETLKELKSQKEICVVKKELNDYKFSNEKHFTYKNNYYEMDLDVAKELLENDGFIFSEEKKENSTVVSFTISRERLLEIIKESHKIKKK